MDKSCHLVDSDDTGVFVEREWIEVGKRYGGPGFPEAEMLARLAIPNRLSELAKLPKQDISVTQFIVCQLPHVSSEFITTKTDK